MLAALQANWNSTDTQWTFCFVKIQIQTSWFVIRGLYNLFCKPGCPGLWKYPECFSEDSHSFWGTDHWSPRDRLHPKEQCKTRSSLLLYSASFAFTSMGCRITTIHITCMMPCLFIVRSQWHLLTSLEQWRIDKKNELLVSWFLVPVATCWVMVFMTRIAMDELCTGANTNISNILIINRLLNEIFLLWRTDIYQGKQKQYYVVVLVVVARDNTFKQSPISICKVAQ